MFVTLYHLYFLACLGCQPHVVGRPWHTYEACEAHRPTRLSFCVTERDVWVRK